MKGGAPTRVVVDGQGFLMVGVLSWGHEPFGADPVAWSCERCAALVTEPTVHVAWHREGDLNRPTMKGELDGLGR